MRSNVFWRSAALLSVAAATLLIPAAAAPAQELPAEEMQRMEDAGMREIIVRRDPGLTAAERADVRADADVAFVRRSTLAEVELVRARPDELIEAVGELNSDPDVRFAEPNGTVRASTNDTHWNQLWGLNNTGQIFRAGFPSGTADADIDAPEAWALTLGAGQTVAVVDTGVDFAHQDLTGRFATNPGETGSGRDSNGVDDDGNGYVDDWRGWDFASRDKTASDGNGHGTHVAGTIAASKDNFAGVVGVAPSATILPIQVLSAGGTGTALAVAEGFDYAGDREIPVVNASLGGGFSQVEKDAIAAHPNTTYVVAAGNDGADNDPTPTYPCAFPEANVVCVGATDANDARASFSNFGAGSVDLFAPGVDIRSTYIASSGCPSPCYAYLRGTSMASPHVAGIAALMRARTPSLSTCELKGRLLASGDVKPGLSGTSVTGARANAATAVAAAGGSTPVVQGADSDFDCIGALSDNCTGVANADQSDRDADGAGDPCDMTPDGPPPTPPAPPAPVATPSPIPPTVVPVTPAPVRLAPVLTQAALNPSRITRTKPAVATFRLDRAATVRLTASRKAGSRFLSTATVALRATRGSNSYLLKRKLGSRTLRSGTYRLTVRALDGALTSRASILTFTVRTR